MEKLNLEESERLVKRGSKFFDEGKFKDALECFIRAKRASPSPRIVELIRQAEEAGNFKCNYESSADEIGGDSSSDEVEFDGGRGDGASNRSRRSSSQPNRKSTNGESRTSSSNTRSKETTTTDSKRDREPIVHRDQSNSQKDGDGGARRRSSSCHQLGGDFTREQLEAVQRVRHCNGNYYEILDVEETFTEAELIKHYRQLSLKLHPDHNKAPGAEEAFKVMKHAYDILKDPRRRQLYDNGEDDELESEEEFDDTFPLNVIRYVRVQLLAKWYGDRPNIMCRKCKKPKNYFNGGGVHVTQVIRHILTHLKRPVYSCAICGYWATSEPRTHVNKLHPDQLYKNVVIDHLDDYHDEIMQLLDACFDQDQDG